MAAGAGISSAAGPVANAAVRNQREPQDISKIVIEQGPRNSVQARGRNYGSYYRMIWS